MSTNTRLQVLLQLRADNLKYDVLTCFKKLAVKMVCVFLLFQDSDVQRHV